MPPKIFPRRSVDTRSSTALVTAAWASSTGPRSRDRARGRDQAPATSSDEDLRERFLQEAHVGRQAETPQYRHHLRLRRTRRTAVHRDGVRRGHHAVRADPQRSPAVALAKLELIEELSVGLDYAHNKGIVHRDVKPANMMIDRDGVAEDSRLRHRAGRRLGPDAGRRDDGHAELHVAGAGRGAAGRSAQRYLRRRAGVLRTCCRTGRRLPATPAPGDERDYAARRRRRCESCARARPRSRGDRQQGDSEGSAQALPDAGAMAADIARARRNLPVAPRPAISPT